MWRWLAAFVVILLGVAWFVRGDEFFAGEPDVQAAGTRTTRGPVVVDVAPAQARREVEDRPSGTPEPRARAGSPSVVVPPADSNRPQPALKGRESAQATAGDGRTAVDGALAEAQRRVERGEVRGAEGLVREAMAKAESAWEKGRCALQLASLTSDAVERRRLVTFALSQGAVRGAEYDAVSQLLRELNRQPSSIVPLIDVAQYTVRPNDNLWTLCTKTFPGEFGASPEVGLVQLLNGMSSERLDVGQTILVPRNPLRLEIDRREHGLVAYLGDVVLVAYRVGLGKENRTPQGEFVVQVKQKEPTWYRAGRAIPFGDPANILGTRWMGFENSPGVTGYGIHGTANPETVGFDESMGCVRMRNEEVEELFELVPRGTAVTIP
ncbi:MAG: L,D-transpeptidase family protein [Planctomycetes bacterium]|nr:L,D-transpeptidase family protein [Planctomycetota bacterium]